MTHYKIKQLEWKEVNGWYYAAAQHYWYKIVDKEDGYLVLYQSNYITLGSEPLTLQAAKEAAQKHYENEVKKHLEEV